MGGTGLEPVTPSLSIQSRRPLMFAERSIIRANPRFPSRLCSMSYTFRVRFKLGRRVRIQSDADELTLADDAVERESVRLRPRDRDVGFGDADELVMTGKRYEGEEAAEEA